jgi:hypothetical protein
MDRWAGGAGSVLRCRDQGLVCAGVCRVSAGTLVWCRGERAQNRAPVTWLTPSCAACECGVVPSSVLWWGGNGGRVHRACQKGPGKPQPPSSVRALSSRDGLPACRVPLGMYPVVGGTWGHSHTTAETRKGPACCPSCGWGCIWQCLCAQGRVLSPALRSAASL